MFKSKKKRSFWSYNIPNLFCEKLVSSKRYQSLDLFEANIGNPIDKVDDKKL
jgi:hypothetical protein